MLQQVTATMICMLNCTRFCGGFFQNIRKPAVRGLGVKRQAVATEYELLTFRDNRKQKPCIRTSRL
jgi:hypothetical protein